MSAHEIRQLTPGDKFRHSQLMAHAFSGGQVQTPPDPHAAAAASDNDSVARAAQDFGLFESGDLRAAYSIAPFQVCWGQSAVLPMGGIAGVATWAEARGRGHVGTLLRHSLETMRAAGQIISALYPFAWAFYRRYGWEWVGEKRRITLPLAHVRAAPEGKNVRDLSGANADTVQETLAPIYSAFAQQYRGVCDAATHQWKNALQHRDNRTTYVYVHQAPGRDPDGYLLWRYGRDGKNAQVREFLANTPEAYRGLLSVLHYLGTQASKADVSPLPTDHLLWHHVMHWDVETKVAPVFMGRVVDVAAALAAIVAPPDLANGAVTLAVADEHAPWNHRPWLVAGENGVVTCAPAAAPGKTPDLSCDIQAFSQLFWGTPSLETLIRAGRVAVNNPAGADWLGRLLAGPPVFTLDDF